MTNEEIAKQAIGYIKDRVNKWKEPIVYVTPKVAFNIKTLVETARKNYWGIFDVPTDPNTGMAKYWVPLTESYVESSVKNTDTDPEDIRVKGITESGLKLSPYYREALLIELDKMFFGDTLNDKERRKAIDGTAIVKVNLENKRPVKAVDRLNFFIDPLADSIQDTEIVVERSLMTIEEIKTMKGWINTDRIKTKKNLSSNAVDNQENPNEMVDVYEAWGNIPKSYITGNEADKDEKESGHIVICDLFNNPVCSLIETNPGEFKPYEEDWYIKVPGRWDGRGVPEKLLMLQVWLNLVVNTRIIRGRINQIGLFKARRGKGITAQSLANMTVNGVLMVDDLTDIEQFITQDVPQSSYNDENTIRDWTERVTHSFEIANGESLPSTTTATIGAIQNANSKTFFELVRENSSSFVERLIERHLQPEIINRIKKNKKYMLELDSADVTRADNAKKAALAKQGLDLEENMPQYSDMGNKREICLPLILE
jgi:hypothetical protein